MDDLAAHRQRLVGIDMQAERGIVAVAQLDDAGDADEIDPGAEVEAADDRRPGQDEDGDVLVVLDQGMGDGPAAAQVAEAEGVVAVDQNARAVAGPLAAATHAHAVQPWLRGPDPASARLCHSGRTVEKRRLREGLVTRTG